MDANLRRHFDEAVGGDPGAEPAELARVAIVQGGRVRRRRWQTAVAGAAAGVVLVLGIVAAVNGRSGDPAPGRPPAAAAPAAPGTSPGGSGSTPAPAMELVAASGCSERPVASDATDAVIIVGPNRQPAPILSALRSDARVGSVRFESREQAFERFKKLWADSPDFVQSVTPESMVESFRLRLADATQYAAFRSDYSARDDVALVEGRVCPVTAAVGGVR